MEQVLLPYLEGNMKKKKKLTQLLRGRLIRSKGNYGKKVSLQKCPEQFHRVWNKIWIDSISLAKS